MKYIREGDWTCAPVLPAVADRRVEITGPVERKMINSALNSGAIVFMVTDVWMASQHRDPQDHDLATVLGITTLKVECRDTVAR
ncbi:hypothetical protein CXB51_021389 [Gossypium anomalum]|uniref:Uncharacterized protein n=1 Tax=Gossypium anomalum TaxID=47600 RepID=A0A8J6CUT4_9ROSI|nr:hypothetical protein CXB51_021389 [Gossypium anomalum]